MKRTDLTLTIALCASLLLHGLVIDALIERETHQLALTTRQPPFNLAALLAAKTSSQSAAIIIPDPPPKPRPLIEDIFGEHHSHGKGLNSIAGDQPMQAPTASQDQATLTPKPGHPSDGGSGGAIVQRASPLAEQPAAAVAMVPFGLPKQPPFTDPLGNPIIPAPPLLPPKPFHQQREHADNTNEPFSDPSPTTRSVALADHSTTTQPVKIVPTTRPIETAKKPQPTSAPIVDAATTPPVATTQLAMATHLKLPPGKIPSAAQPNLDHPAKPQPPAVAANTSPTVAQNIANQGHGPSGDLGHRSESESDPFSDHPVIIYRDGKVEARDGRKVTTKKPKFTEAGRLALQAMDKPIFFVEFQIDENGKVTNAEILNPSNKPEVDQPQVRAAYYWEFEPARDKNGHPHPDTQIIPFVWY